MRRKRPWPPFPSKGQATPQVPTRGFLCWRCLISATLRDPVAHMEYKTHLWPIAKSIDASYIPSIPPASFFLSGAEEKNRLWVGVTLKACSSRPRATVIAPSSQACIRPSWVLARSRLSPRQSEDHQYLSANDRLIRWTAQWTKSQFAKFRISLKSRPAVSPSMTLRQVSIVLYSSRPISGIWCKSRQF